MIKIGKRAELPPTLAPQLAVLVNALPATLADWQFEIKFDGYRLLARIDGRDIKLFTRNGNDWTYKLEPLRAILAKMKLPGGWYDGEIIVSDDPCHPLPGVHRARARQVSYLKGRAEGAEKMLAKGA